MGGLKQQKNRLEKGLEKHCKINGVDFQSLKKLVEAEKTKKLLRRNAFVQQTIDKEIDNLIENENKKNYPQ